MDAERKREQEKANAWQETSVRLIHRVRMGVAVFGILVVAWLFVNNIGFPKTVDESLAASVFTGSGEMLTCDVRLQGEITEYPLQKGKYSREDELVLFVDGRKVLAMPCRVDKETGNLFFRTDFLSCVMTPDRSRIWIAADIRDLFPERESEPCVLVAPGGSSREDLLQVELPEVFRDAFAWFVG